MNLFTETESSAVISDCGLYRYSLIREWHSNKGRCLFVMLNPSTADADKDDPTIRRCIGFAKRWGYGSLEVVNLFALRATKPADMFNHAAPVGDCNDYHIRQASSRASTIIAAWGVGGSHMDRDREVMRILERAYCLSLTLRGFPSHPLYVPAASVPFRYEGRKER